MCPERDAWCRVYVNHVSNMNTWCQWTCSCFLGSYEIVLAFHFLFFLFCRLHNNRSVFKFQLCGPKREDSQMIEGLRTKPVTISIGKCMDRRNPYKLPFTVSCRGTTCSYISLMLEIKSTYTSCGLGHMQIHHSILILLHPTPCAFWLCRCTQLVLFSWWNRKCQVSLIACTLLFFHARWPSELKHGGCI